MLHQFNTHKRRLIATVAVTATLSATAERALNVALHLAVTPAPMALDFRARTHPDIAFDWLN